MKPLKTYACYLKKEEIRMSSSSGAVFFALASYIFSVKGIVYGVAMSEDCYSAEFISATDIKGLERLRGSKYLQAKVGDTFKKVKANLASGKMILFTGTGCQINGLKSFLGKDYDNLICVDVICHGTPSPVLWRKYVQYQELINRGNLKHINFRCKDNIWTDSGMKEVVVNIPENKIKKVYISKDNDFYMQVFLKNYCLRPSCYECVAKNVKMSDLTIADFWGIDEVAPEMNDNKGTSLVLVRTEKGQRLFEEISREMVFKEVSYENGIKNNLSEYMSVVRPAQRDIFLLDMLNMSFEELQKKYAISIVVSKRTKVKRKIKSLIMPILRIIAGRAEYCNVDYGLLFVFRV